MAVDDLPSRYEYSGNGATTEFAFSSPVFRAGDLKVYLVGSNGTETLQTINTHYTIAIAGDKASATVTFVTAPAADEDVVLDRQTQLVQERELSDNNLIEPDVYEELFDEGVLRDKEMSQRIDDVMRRTGVSSSSPFDANERRIVNVADPTNDQDAATKAYVVSQTASSVAAAAASATDAAAAKAGAESARDATLAAFDNFDDRYLGAKSSDPATDNDGDPLNAGAIYFNTVSQVMRLYTGSAWVAAYVSGGEFVARDGTQGMQADLPMGGNKITGLADGEADGDAATVRQVTAATTQIPAYIDGLFASNGTDTNNDIDIAAGSIRGNDVYATSASTITKRLDAAWAEGTGEGGLDTGSKANSTTYHIHAIRKDSDGTLDFLFSTSASSPTVPSGWTRIKRIWSVITDSSGNILRFKQVGRHKCQLRPSQADVNTSSLGTTRTSYALTVPAGLQVDANFRAVGFASGGVAAIILSSPEEDDLGPTAGMLADIQSPAAGAAAAGDFRKTTNTSRQITARSSAASTTLRIYTHGWIDHLED